MSWLGYFESSNVSNPNIKEKVKQLNTFTINFFYRTTLNKH